VLVAALTQVGRFGHQVQLWRVEAGVAQPSMATSIKDVPLEELTGIVLGALFAGFRSQAANFCWWKSQQYWEEEGKWPRVLPMMKAACALDPYFPEFWEVTGWHEAYNLAAEYETRHLPQDEYIKMGLETLETGLRYNPKAIQLYEQVGWTYRDKLGDPATALKYSRQAATVYHVRAGITKQTPLIQPRFIAHMYEELGKPEDALLQYQEIMQDYPADSVGIGASLTIRDRYLQAFRAKQASEYDSAASLLQRHLEHDPGDKLALHMLAQTKEAEGDTYGALAAWEAAASVWKDTYAQQNYVRMLREINRRDTQLRSMPFFDMVISRKVADFLLQPQQTATGAVMPRGQGVSLYKKAPGAETPSPLGAKDPVNVGDEIHARPFQMRDLSGCEARFYLHGREVGRDSTPPFTFVYTEDMRPGPGNASAIDLMLKVEFFVPDEQARGYPPRFDLRQVAFEEEPQPADQAGPSGPTPPPAMGPGGQGGPGGPGGPVGTAPGAPMQPGPSPAPVPPTPSGGDEHEGHDH
jgi:tetratricopeptide (TPR) repeat protein